MWTDSGWTRKNYEMTFREGRTRRVTESQRRSAVTEVKDQVVSQLSKERSSERRWHQDTRGERTGQGSTEEDTHLGLNSRVSRL